MWMLEEAGLEYDLRTTIIPSRLDSRPPVTRDELKKLNVSGKVPILVDGDLVLSESLGINLYLAHLASGSLAPKSEREWAHAYQWTSWVLNEVDKPLEEVVLFRRSGAIATAPESELARDEQVRTSLLSTLSSLDRRLTAYPWLAGPGFGVADLNVASVLALVRPSGVELTSLSNLATWLDRALGRPAARSVFRKVIADAREQGFIGKLQI
jgi:glutathione S-transferase